MPKDILQYNIMVEAALRSVVRQSLTDVGQFGLPGEHHFYITFRTAYPGVQVPEYLKARYPAEMTIVLQFQFDDLEVTETYFAVTLTFNQKRERLIVPLAAITVFADPSVNFALPFQAPELPEETPVATKAGDGTGAHAPGEKHADKASDGGEKGGEVVSLDKFRKK